MKVQLKDLRGIVKQLEKIPDNTYIHFNRTKMTIDLTANKKK